MTKTVNEQKVLDELKELRVENNIRLLDLAEELGMSTGQLSMHESGVRKLRTYNIEAFEEDYRCAVKKIKERNDEYEVDHEGLVWKKVTPERLSIAKELMERGRNIVQVGIELGVDEESLIKEMDRHGITS